MKVVLSTYVNVWGGSWQFPMSVSVHRLQRALWLRRTVIDAPTARLHLRNIQSSPNHLVKKYLKAQQRTWLVTGSSLRYRYAVHIEAVEEAETPPH